MLLSVSDFQGFPRVGNLPPLSKCKPPISSIRQHHRHHIFGASLTRRRRSLATSTFLFLSPLCCFCQLDTATPFGSWLIHSFGCPSFKPRLFQDPPPHFQPQPNLTCHLYPSAPVQHPLGRTVGRITCRPVLLIVAALRSFESLLVGRDF